MAKESPFTTRRQTPTLTSYLARRFAMYLALTLAVLAAFIYLIDVVDLISKAGGHNLSTFTLLRMSLMKLPNLMQQMLPFAVLLGTLVTLNQLNRRQELVALRASGLPARRIMLGPLLVVVLVGVFALTLLNPLSATLLKNYERWHSETFPGSARGLVTAGGSIWLKQSESQKDIFIYGRKVGNNGQILHNATVFVLNEDGTFRNRTDAETMTLQPGYWQLTDATIISTDQRAVRLPSATLETHLTPAMIQNSFTPADTLSVWELRTFIHVLRQTGFPSTPHEVTYQRLLSLPAFLIAMFLLGVPFALAFTRTRNLGAVVGAGLGMGFGFYFFSNAMAALGLAGRLNVVLAAWVPALIAVLLAVALLIHLREE